MRDQLFNVSLMKASRMQTSLKLYGRYLYVSVYGVCRQISSCDDDDVDSFIFVEYSAVMKLIEHVYTYMYLYVYVCVWVGSGGGVWVTAYSSHKTGEKLDRVRSLLRLKFPSTMASDQLDIANGWRMLSPVENVECKIEFD